MKPIIDKVATGRLIQKRMDELGLSIDDVANELGLSYQAVWKYTQGKALPDLDHTYELQNILKCSIDDLIVANLDF